MVWLLIGIEPETHQIGLADGQSLNYDKLILATGAIPRTLPPAAGLGNVNVLRNPDDAAALRQADANSRYRRGDWWRLYWT